MDDLNVPGTGIADFIASPKYKLTDNAISAVKELVKYEIEKIFISIPIEELVMKRYQSILDQYMMKQYPDLSNRLNQMALDLKDEINNFSKKLKDMVNREKNLIKSESVYEDVYKMRDELKTIQQLTSKLKKAFET